jgi:hypothetical protein
MSAAAASEISEEQFLANVAEVCAVEPVFSQISAAVLVAIDLGIARDSRTFSRIFGVAHALVLREISDLSTGDRAVLKVISRNDRTQRTELELAESGRQLLVRARKPAAS